jgi:hypothetical protein
MRKSHRIPPPFIGAPPQPPPDPSGLPPGVREAETARGIVMERILPMPPKGKTDAEGTVTGTFCVSDLIFFCFLFSFF